MITTTWLRSARATAGVGRSRAAIVAAIVVIGWWSTGTARAGVTSFALSPSSGPAGTVVTVSGTDCTPVVLPSPLTDFVEVTAPSLGVALHVPVEASGSWQDTFPVPPNANAGPAPVTAHCVIGSLPSLTVYTLQTFTVTTSSPTTTTTPTTTPTTSTTGGTGGTTPTTGPGGSTPTTRGGPPGTGGGSNPSSTVPTLEGVPPGGSNGGASGGGGAGTSAPGAGATKADAHRTAREAAKARAADLRAPDLLAARVSGASGLGWLAWLLLIALVSAAVAAPLWLRRFRRRDIDSAAMGDVV